MPVRSAKKAKLTTWRHPVDGDDEQVDAAVNRGLGDGLDLGDIQVVVYRVGRVFASAVVCQTSGAGLRKGHDGR